MAGLFIADGYTEAATIRGVSSEPLEFTFRPALSVDYAKFVDDNEKAREVETRKAMAKFCAARIVSWNVKDDRGADVAISEENLLRLRPPVLPRLFRIVVSQVDVEADAKN